MQVKLGFSLLLLALAAVFAMLDLSSLQLNSIIVVGILATGFSAFIKVFKSYFLVKTTAVSSYQLVNRILPDVQLAPGPFTVQLMQPMKIGFSKMIGKGLLLFSKFLELLSIALAATISLFYLLAFSLGHKDPIVFLGIYLILLAFLVLVLERISITIPVDKTIELALLGLDFSSWVMDAIGIWIILFSLGFYIPFQYVFLPVSILLLSTKFPSYYGLGISELVGMFVIHTLGAPLFLAFLAVLVWDLSSLFFSYLFTLSWRNLEMRREMYTYV